MKLFLTVFTALLFIAATTSTAQTTASAAPLRVAIAGMVHGHVEGFLQHSLRRSDIQIVGIAERAPADKMVHTQIMQSNGKPVAINYLMRKTGPDWKVVDVYLDGTISELASRRAEFTSIMRAGGPDALIASLRKQGDRLLAGR